MPAKISSTTWVTRSRMKFRRMREVYWLDASASVIRVIENVTPTTVIIEPAIRGQPPARAGRAGAKQARPADQPFFAPVESASIKAAPKAMLPATISEGTNQKLARRLLHNRLSLFIVQPSMCRSTVASTLVRVVAGLAVPGTNRWLDHISCRQ